MKSIKLSVSGKNRGKYSAIVDDEDYESLIKWKWYASKVKNTIYAARSVYSDSKITIYMHRYILKLEDELIFCDHIDHNGLNNQRSNLRECNNRENQMNRSEKINMTSKYPGVSYDKLNCKWRAVISINKKQKCLGRFNNEIDASKAYIKAIK